jgi:hypothetical protein
VSLALGCVCGGDKAFDEQMVFTYPRVGCADVDAVVCAQLTWLLDDVGIPRTGATWRATA